MKKASKKTTKKEMTNEDLANIIDKLAAMTVKGFSDLEGKLTNKIDAVDNRLSGVESKIATRADILELHDKFIHRREFDQLALRVSKLEERKIKNK